MVAMARAKTPEWKRTYRAPPGGRGAVYGDGNKNVGPAAWKFSDDLIAVKK